MKQLILTRHAKAKNDFFLDDYDRPLIQQGENEAKLMANQLLKNNICPDLMISSGANRALSTSKIISNIISYPQLNIEINNDIYNANVQDIIQIIKNVDDKKNTLMITGHNPSLYNLTQHFSNEVITAFPTCTIVYIHFDINNWINVIKGKIEFLIYPDLFI